MKRSIAIVLLISTLIYARAVSDIELFFNSPLINAKPLNQCESVICKGLLEQIQNAEESIDFALYGTRNQDTLLQALLEAKKRGVKIRGVMDSDVHGHNHYSSTEKWKKVLGNIVTDQHHSGSYIMHHKFFIFDQKLVWSGSANVSDSGTGGYNANGAFVVSVPHILRQYTREFNQMYEEERFHRQKKAYIGKQINAHEKLQARFSPQGKVIQKNIIPLVRSAQQSIDLMLFYLTHKDLSEALIYTHKRGVPIRVIMDATGAANKYSQHERLREAGIKVKVENWGGKMHLKAAVIDRNKIILGSMNWTKAGESTNDENTLFVFDEKSALEGSKYFETLWKSIPDRWLKGRPGAESLASHGSCHDGVDNDFDRHADQLDSACSKFTQRN